MENRMSRSEQPLEDNQSTISLEEQYLVKRIIKLTLLLGILIGISLIFLAVVLNNTFLIPRGSFHLVTPVVDKLLLPIVLILFGVVFIIQWNLQLLRGRYIAFQRSIDSTFSLQLGILGMNFAGLGCLFLLIQWGNLPSKVVFPIIGLWFLSFLAVYFYLPFRKKRRENISRSTNTTVVSMVD